MDGKKEKGLPVKTRRIIAYTVFVLITILCLFWFYVLFINATRSNAELNRGFTMIPSKYAAKNFKGIIHGTQPIFTGLLNSFIVAACTSFLCTYFSTVTAFAIYAYDFKLKKAIFTFILVSLAGNGARITNPFSPLLTCRLNLYFQALYPAT